VLGPHRRSGLLGHLQGSVAAANCAELTDRRRFRNTRQAKVARARAALAFAWSHFTVAKGTRR
jgi:hypothetical protein